MTNQHPITPPPELLHDCYGLVQKHLNKGFPLQFGISHALRRAYAAGADQELEACCEWVAQWCAPRYLGDAISADALCAARRPKPPSLKEQALEALEQIDGHAIRQMSAYVIYDELKTYADIIRRALEALPND
jgi:hypothetical protein